MPVIGDGMLDIPLPEKCEELEMDDKDYGMFKGRLYAQLDRQHDNSTNFTNVLQMQYAGSQAFRDATASRIVLEAGSGRTRAETNNPGATSAAGNPAPGGAA